MLKIHDKLWYVKRTNEDLAYMTYYKEDKAFEKRKETGTSWSGSSEEGVICANKPLEGFIVGQSVSRYSTSNKLFRVMDPRGFEVEIPTDNLAMLLQSCTITNSVVQEKCVWGREGSNHILLNEGSEPYKAAMENMDKLAHEVIKPKDHVVGDVLKTSDSWLFLYLGKVKITYEIKLYKRHANCYGEYNSGSVTSSEPFYETTLQDKTVRLYYRTWADGLLWKEFREYGYCSDTSTRFLSRGKAERGAVEACKSYLRDRSGRCLTLPKRITSKLPEECQEDLTYYTHHRSIHVEFKASFEYLEEK